MITMKYFISLSMLTYLALYCRYNVKLKLQTLFEPSKEELEELLEITNFLLHIKPL